MLLILSSLAHLLHIGFLLKTAKTNEYSRYFTRKFAHSHRLSTPETRGCSRNFEAQVLESEEKSLWPKEQNFIDQVVHNFKHGRL